MKKNKKRVMIDIETMALGSNAAVWQIGWYQFTGDGEFSGEVTLNPYDQNRMIDPSTVKWLESNVDNWTEIEKSFPSLIPTSIQLETVADVITDNNPDEVWCKGSDFDFATLRNMFIQYEILLPWHYRTQCCMRTFLNTFPEYKINFADKSKGHTAKYDAMVQAECVIKVLEKVDRL